MLNKKTILWVVIVIACLLVIGTLSYAVKDSKELKSLLKQSTRQNVTSKYFTDVKQQNMFYVYEIQDINNKQSLKIKETKMNEEEKKAAEAKAAEEKRLADEAAQKAAKTASASINVDEFQQTLENVNQRHRYECR